MRKDTNLLKYKFKNIKHKKYVVMHGINKANCRDVETLFNKYRDKFERIGIGVYLRTSLNQKHEKDD